MIQNKLIAVVPRDKYNSYDLIKYRFYKKKLGAIRKKALNRGATFDECIYYSEIPDKYKTKDLTEMYFDIMESQPHIGGYSLLHVPKRVLTKIFVRRFLENYYPEIESEEGLSFLFNNAINEGLLSMKVVSQIPADFLLDEKIMNLILYNIKMSDVNKLLPIIPDNVYQKSISILITRSRKGYPDNKAGYRIWRNGENVYPRQKFPGNIVEIYKAMPDIYKKSVCCSYFIKVTGEAIHFDSLTDKEPDLILELFREMFKKNGRLDVETYATCLSQILWIGGDECRSAFYEIATSIPDDIKHDVKESLLKKNNPSRIDYAQTWL